MRNDEWKMENVFGFLLLATADCSYLPGAVVDPF
jgi:hypothetical protein